MLALTLFLLSPSPTPPPDEMQPPPGYENKDEKPNRYKESKIIITREEALDALRKVFKSITQNIRSLRIILEHHSWSYEGTILRLQKWHIKPQSDYVDAQCCWGKGPIRRMEILNETQYLAYVYTLER